MRKNRSLIGVLFVSFIFCLALSVQPAEAEYPERSITLVVPFPPGGVSDLGARVLANAMEKYFNKPVVVANRLGGGGTVGGYAVTTAKPDGYTLGYFPPMASIPEVYTYFFQAPYSSNDLKPVGRVGTIVGTITVKNDSPLNSFKDLVEFIRKNPGAKWGLSTKSSAAYIVTRTIAKTEKVNIIDVSLDGDANIVPAILGGHIPVGSPTYPSVRSHIAANQLKLLALLVEKRADSMPRVPTLVELGYRVPPGTYLAAFAPKGTPDPVIRILNDAMGRISQDPGYSSKLMELGILPEFEESKSFEASLKREIRELQNFFKEEGLVK